MDGRGEKRTSEYNDGKGCEDDVIEQDEGILVQIRSVEAVSVGRVLASVKMYKSIGTNLLYMRYQNMAKVQITFCIADSEPVAASGD